MNAAALMQRSLEGLSVGDAFGERFFQPPGILGAALQERRVPGQAPWTWTDDTAMAISIVETLTAQGTIEPNELAGRFGRRYSAEPSRDGLQKASRLGFDVPATHAAAELGSGAKVLSSDTVPFSMWCALKHHDDFVEAMWTTVSGLGDRDTTCAIVGGLVALNDPPPAQWVRAREPLPL